MYKTISNQIKCLIGTNFCYVGLSKRFSINRLRWSKILQSQNYQILGKSSDKRQRDTWNALSSCPVITDSGLNINIHISTTCIQGQYISMV